MSDLQFVNGNQLSWGSAVFKLDGDRFTGITGMTFADKRERVKAYGMGRHHAPRGRSAGKYSVEPVKIVGWRASIAIFRLALAARALDHRSYGNVEFQIYAQYVEADDMPLTVEINRVVWTGNSASDEESADPLKEEIECDAMFIRRDGLTLFDSTEGGP